MSLANQTFRGSATLNPPTTSTIFNVSVPTANTEVSQTLPVGTKKIFIKCRGTAKIQYSFVVTESATKFITIPRGATQPIDGINFSGDIYFQTSEGSQVVEIEAWT